MDEKDVLLNIFTWLENILVLILSGLGAWMLSKLSNLENRLQTHELNVVSKYVTQDSVNSFREELIKQVERLEDKLEDKIIRMESKIDKILAKVNE